ncbi:bifunctional serine/threonine-protein kinase/formylglycine-generating enzyme family protein [Synechocystis sp. PCC 7338]|uniref:bifunctional serine/threonine-protein kinase/formylglycine-generating enzyme family protein n=1 Tax=Synechocystis sp. PCC 7338 TaxID=2732530 RepID=UPI001BAF9BDF|nr:bifunctional serine/threonine-protein kinase/formylglycine-generating enzyme family protein [Synechocystis sp. PCC 7338]QUS60478.1 SUMF1/EgtB/PvdO family nonheme iron enzyme [Synechocystis sp. PCC 7338]
MPIEFSPCFSPKYTIDGEEFMVNTNPLIFRMMAGQRIGQYHLEKLLGAGGFGAVFLASEVVMERALRQVAIKIIPNADEAKLEELIAAANLSHGNLIKTYAAGEGELNGTKIFYLAMELAAESLEHHLQQRQLSPTEIRNLFTAIARGLAYLHGKNQVHRDLKPANILRVGEQWKLSDFGLIKHLDEHSYAQTINPLGTIPYMPPEAFDGIVSPAWDVWSLGIMVVQITAQRLPYQFDNQTQLLKRVMEGDIDLPPLPPPWGELALACLAKDRRQRWAIADVLQFLTQPTPRFPEEVTEGGAIGEDSKYPNRRKVLILCGLMAVGASGGTIFFSRSQTKTLAEYQETLPNNAALTMVTLAGGEFLMGSTTSDKDAQEWETPQHLVQIAPFAMGKYPITRQQWQAIMQVGANSKYFQDFPHHPMEWVSWYQAEEFCQRLSQISGKIYKLPSEAQWEYACRAGSKTRFYFGDNAKELNKYGWYKGNSNGWGQMVGRKQPNGWGLYDISGNVWEWCEDTWHENYQGFPGNSGAWVTEPDGSPRVLRGGSWKVAAPLCRSASRIRLYPDKNENDCGLRVVCLSV